jgi:hypothetical protein
MRYPGFGYTLQGLRILAYPCPFWAYHESVVWGVPVSPESQPFAVTVESFILLDVQIRLHDQRIDHMDLSAC